MSEGEFSRLKVMVDLVDGRLSVEAAAALMDIGQRQVFRLRRAFETRGPAGLVSGKRGKPSNRAHGAALRRAALGLVRDRYADFGPTLAAEKLAELHSLRLGVETLRQWMIADGLWVGRKERRVRVFQPRPRRSCLGELVQIDGSAHWWFEDRGLPCTLLVYVDDATGRLMALRLVETESAFDYFRATRVYIERHGKPVAFYSDKHSIFRVAKADAVGGSGMTQFGRALHDLNIDILCANTPQAKGRVERANRTLQDRLVKEFRLKGIGTIEAGNAALPGFVAAYNARFARPARDGRDAHRPLGPADDMDTVFSWQVERTVSHSLTLQYDKVLFLLRPDDATRDLARQRVMVHDFPDGRLEIRHQGRTLPYVTFDKLQQVPQGSVVANKNLDAAVAAVRAEQDRTVDGAVTVEGTRSAHTVPVQDDRLGAALAHVRVMQSQTERKRTTSAPRRRGQADHMFKVG